MKLQKGKPKAAEIEAVHFRGVDTGKNLEVCAVAEN